MARAAAWLVVLEPRMGDKDLGPYSCGAVERFVPQVWWALALCSATQVLISPERLTS